MAKINGNYANLPQSYLFSEIGKRTKEFAARHPEAKIIRLGIGDTTQPLPPVIVDAIVDAGRRLGTVEGYKAFGHYGDELGMKTLREAIATKYASRGVQIDSSEVLISDGAKSDLGNLQSIFGMNNTVALQDPVYPAYLDVSVINGRGGELIPSVGQHAGIAYMRCTPENNFSPEIPITSRGLIYLCSPNNPTGAVMTRSQLEEFVEYARAKKAIIIFDAAYSAFISNPNLPRSIYEIEGAKKCAIEVQSFSKSAGFTGLRLGWTVVPKELECDDAGPGELNMLWNRRQSTFFNGASNIAQMAGLAALTPEGQAQCQQIIDYYMANVKTIREGLTEAGLHAYGGVNAPYIWARTPNSMNSWKFFDKLLEEAWVVGTPGSGFGPSGEGFFRLSGFGFKEDTEEAVQRIKTRLKV